MLPSQVVWQPYEAEFEDLLPWCVAGRAVWTATVPLVCFHLVEKHTPDRVVRQFGMIQEISRNVNTDTVLHAIDLRGKVGVDWMRKHAAHITEWGSRLQQRCEAVLGDMPPQHEYFDWYKRVTRRFINVLGARLIIMIEGYARLLRRHPVGTEDHKDITDVLNAVQEIGRVQAPIPEASNEEAATPAAAPTQSPSTSRALVGRGSCSSVATPRVVPTPDPHPSTPNPSPSPTIPSHIPHPSPSPTIPSPIPHPSSSPTTIPSPTPHPCPGSDIRPPTPQSFPELSPIPSFNLGLDLTPPDMHPQPPSHSTSTGPSSGIDPSHVHVEQPVGLPAEAGVFKDGGKEGKKKDPTSSSVKCFFIRMESIEKVYEARSSFMHAHRLPSVANYMARFSLILSKTTKVEVDLASVNIQTIEDVLCMTNPSIVELESNLLAMQRQESKAQEPPLLIQFRLFNNGCAVKGTLLVNKKDFDSPLRNTLRFWEHWNSICEYSTCYKFLATDYVKSKKTVISMCRGSKQKPYEIANNGYNVWWLVMENSSVVNLAIPRQSCSEIGGPSVLCAVNPATLGSSTESEVGSSSQQSKPRPRHAHEVQPRLRQPPWACCQGQGRACSQGQGSPHGRAAKAKAKAAPMGVLPRPRHAQGQGSQALGSPHVHAAAKAKACTWRAAEAKAAPMGVLPRPRQGRQPRPRQPPRACCQGQGPRSSQGQGSHGRAAKAKVAPMGMLPRPRQPGPRQPPWACCRCQGQGRACSQGQGSPHGRAAKAKAWARSSQGLGMPCSSIPEICFPSPLQL
ncbi:hypothetical protein CMV_025547 [Castanea mollissima]|uniref:RNA-dependent RNA polymerase n=1 Tax=Castanea mollissima TaxID=60419 RepID=A0A8J4VGU2_9ROSI|nr:hypothetical protein CMV_025547 [Castanea mollissima]